MLVRFSEDSSTGMGASGFRYSQAKSNGADLRFVDQHGAELKYEIANWNPAGESQVWVRVPSLKSDANITAYWGNSNARACPVMPMTVVCGMDTLGFITLRVAPVMRLIRARYAIIYPESIPLPLCKRALRVLHIKQMIQT